MPLDPLFIRTNQIYEQNASEARKRIGRRLNESEAQRVWLQAADQARQEEAQHEQKEVLGTAVDQAYEPELHNEQPHEAATITALEDLRRGAKELTEA